MRKSIILLALILGGLTANAQSVVEGTKVTDNWSVEVNAGAITPLTHSVFFKSMRPAFGVGVSKQLTPIFGLGFQGMGYINTTPSKTSFDASDVSVLGKVNLMNLFAGYKGEPRLFEVEAVAGMGWLHYYVNGDGDQNTSTWAKAKHGHWVSNLPLCMICKALTPKQRAVSMPITQVSN